MSRWLFLLLFLTFGSAQAGERIDICFNYGCVAEQTAVFSESQLTILKSKLSRARTAKEERAVLSGVIGDLYRWAGQQTPVRADRGGNIADEAVNGAMDCIDHSTTTTRFLKMLERRGWLRFHEVNQIARRRRFIMEHYSAVIEERPHPWLPKVKEEDFDFSGDAKPHQYAVDTWFRSNGKPATILPLEDWKDGAGVEEPD